MKTAGEAASSTRGVWGLLNASVCLRHTLRAWTPGRLRGCAARALLPQPERDTACVPSSPGPVPPIHLPLLAGSSQAEPENRAPCPRSAHCRANEVDRVPLSWRPEQEGGPAGGQSDGPGHPRADPSAQGHSHPTRHRASPYCLPRSSQSGVQRSAHVRVLEQFSLVGPTPPPSLPPSHGDPWLGPSLGSSKTLWWWKTAPHQELPPTLWEV